jgi:hypothetical protein
MYLLGKRKRRVSNKIAQPYDTTLKTWVKENPAEILPVLLPGSISVRENRHNLFLGESQDTGN